MTGWNRTGGIAALVASTTFIVGIAMFATLMSDYATGDPDAGESVAFLVDHQAPFLIWNLVIYIVFGVALVPVVLALHARLSDRTSMTMQIATTFGVIWAGLVIGTGMIANIGLGTIVDLYETEPSSAEPVWSTLDAVQNGLGGGNELVGGLWVLLVSWVALGTKLLPRSLGYLGLVCGIAGLVTVIPALEAVGAVFGLGLIVWFAWLGAFLLRETTRDEFSAPGTTPAAHAAEESGR
ncbi:DUF4386 family protein [Ilumatobacter sp.]|uniref:DUF4386 family protein n=1 Tax=Ilumatobacter sp. TaxID=1967498 RepID=UPI003AF7628C